MKRFQLDRGGFYFFFFFSTSHETEFIPPPVCQTDHGKLSATMCWLKRELSVLLLHQRAFFIYLFIFFHPGSELSAAYLGLKKTGTLIFWCHATHFQNPVPPPKQTWVLFYNPKKKKRKKDDTDNQQQKKKKINSLEPPSSKSHLDKSSSLRTTLT